jgi:predicted transcriptional regulator
MISMHVRVPESLVARLDELAAERGIPRSRLTRQLLEVGLRDHPAPVSEPLSEDELVNLLREKARGGNVSAIRLLLELARRRDPRQAAMDALEQMAAGRRQ